MLSISRLIHLNGAPGVGKTSLARRYLADHPLTLVVDVDALRTNLGQWETHEESKGIARELALALVDRHLAAGHRHPEVDVDDGAVDEIVASAINRLTEIASQRPTLRTISAAADLEQAYQELQAAVDGQTR